MLVISGASSISIDDNRTADGSGIPTATTSSVNARWCRVIRSRSDGVIDRVSMARPLTWNDR
jgi:hypothetical protein